MTAAAIALAAGGGLGKRQYKVPSFVGALILSIGLFLIYYGLKPLAADATKPRTADGDSAANGTLDSDALPDGGDGMAAPARGSNIA